MTANDFTHLRFVNVDLNSQPAVLIPLPFLPPTNHDTITAKLLPGPAQLKTGKTNYRLENTAILPHTNLIPIRQQRHAKIFDPNGHVAFDPKRSQSSNSTLHLNPADPEDYDEDIADDLTVQAAIGFYHQVKKSDGKFLDNEGDGDPDTEMLQTVIGITAPLFGKKSDTEDLTPVSDNQRIGLKLTDKNYLNHWQEVLSHNNDTTIAEIFKNEFSFQKLTTYLLILFEMARSQPNHKHSIEKRIVAILSRPEYPLEEFLTYLYDRHLGNRQSQSKLQEGKKDFHQDLAFQMMVFALETQNATIVGRYIRGFTISVLQRPKPQVDEWPLSENDFQIYHRKQHEKDFANTVIPQEVSNDPVDTNATGFQRIVSQINRFLDWVDGILFRRNSN